MNWSIKAILARFDGNLTAAMVYCQNMAHEYAHLRYEYTEHFYTLMEMRGSRI